MEKCLKHLVVVVVVANHFREMNLSQAKKKERDEQFSIYQLVHLISSMDKFSRNSTGFDVDTALG